MRVFTGKYERTVDAKNRLQLPSHFREAIDPERDGPGLYVTLGETRGTLSIFTERAFEELAARIETEFIPGPESRRFELQFYALANYVDIDSQGRILLPEHLKQKARLQDEVILVGQKYRIDVWGPAEFARDLGIDWKGDEWVEWQGFLRMRPKEPHA